MIPAGAGDAIAEPFAATAYAPSLSPEPLGQTPPAVVASRAKGPSMPPPRSQPVAAWVAVAIVVGLLGGMALMRRTSAPNPQPPISPVTVATTPAPVAVPAVSIPSTVASAVALASAVVASVPPAPPAPRPVSIAAPATDPEDTAPASATSRTASGFVNPHNEARITSPDGPTIVDVQGHHVRLLVALLANESNVATSVIRKDIEWSSWEYTRCFETLYASTKRLDGGTVKVGFDIVEQLPRNATTLSSTFSDPQMGACVTRTVAGKLMNGARSPGAGHVIYAFQFVVD